MATGRFRTAAHSLTEKRSADFAATILEFTEEVWGEQFRKAGKYTSRPRWSFSPTRSRPAAAPRPRRSGRSIARPTRPSISIQLSSTSWSRRLGGSKAEFSQAYVIAHEVGHHVQNLLGYSELVDQKRQTLSKEEYNQWSVRLELQADYLAGVWAHYGQEKFHFIEPGDVESAIKSANAIGDDRLQEVPPASLRRRNTPTAPRPSG